MRSTVLSLGVSSLLVVGLLVACSDSSSTSSSSDADAGSSSGDSGVSTTRKDASTTEEDAGDTTATGDSACKAESTLQACATCCAKNHQTGYQTILTTTIACACKGEGADAGTGPCATDCKDTLCAATPAQPTAACNTCIQNAIGQGGACQNAVATKCQADPDCVKEQSCVTPCQGKP